MRKKVYAILLAASLCGALGGSFQAAYAAQTEAAEVLTEAEQALASGETEAETEAAAAVSTGLQPAEITGDEEWASQYPAIEAQVEQQLTSLSQMSQDEVEALIKNYNKQINLSVRDIANSMKDSSTLTAEDDATMATVKMLRNWYSAIETCGAFEGIESYTADMTDGVLTFKMDAKYEQAQKDNTNVDVTFTYDTNQNVTLMTWDMMETIGASIRKAALNTVIGLGTVFVVLLFLSFLIGQIHWVPDLMNRKKAAPEEAAPAPAPAPAAPVVEEVEQTDDLELVAVISAAIAASEQAPADGFVVRSIRRRGRKSNWRA